MSLLQTFLIASCASDGCRKSRCSVADKVVALQAIVNGYAIFVFCFDLLLLKLSFPSLFDPIDLGHISDPVVVVRSSGEDIWTSNVTRTADPRCNANADLVYGD